VDGVLDTEKNVISKLSLSKLDKIIFWKKE
jgi:hypothetical protein